MVDRSNGFDVDDESLPICLARCASGRDKSLTGLLERGIENGQEESSEEGSEEGSCEEGREEGCEEVGLKADFACLLASACP